MKPSKKKKDNIDIEKWLTKQYRKRIDEYKSMHPAILQGSGCKQKPKTEFTCPECGCKFGFKFKDLK